MNRDDETRFITLEVLSEPHQAEMLAELLRNEGIQVATPGLHHRSLLGALGAYVPITLQVPASDLTRARELTVAFLSEGSSSEAETPTQLPRLKRIAAFAALAVPVGAGHLYARAYGRGAALFSTTLTSLLLFFFDINVEALGVAVLVVLVDLVGAMQAVEQTNRGKPPRGFSWNLARGVPYVAPIALASVVFAQFQAPNLYIGQAGRTFCDAANDCALQIAPTCVLRLNQKLAEEVGLRAESKRCADCIHGRACRELQKLDRCHPQCANLLELLTTPDRRSTPRFKVQRVHQR